MGEMEKHKILWGTSLMDNPDWDEIERTSKEGALEVTLVVDKLTIIEELPSWAIDAGAD